MSIYAQNHSSSNTENPKRSVADADSQENLHPDTKTDSASFNFENRNKWTTKQLVVMALMCAIAILLSFIEFPIFPAASFLKLDIALVPSTVVGFAYGAGPGLLVGIVCAVAHAAITGNWVGCIMSAIVAIVFIVPSAAIYKRNHTLKGAIIGLVVGTVCLIVGVSAANLVIDPLFYGMPFEAVAALVVPAIVPFNVIKGIVVSALTALVYKSISNLITPEKDQVKGRK